MKIRELLYKIILGVLAFLIIWIILQGILNYTPIVYDFNPILLIIGMVFYFLIIKYLSSILYHKHYICNSILYWINYMVFVSSFTRKAFFEPYT